MPYPKKPTKLKIIQGTLKAAQRKINDAQPDPEIPTPPDHLNEIALEEYKSISKQLFDVGLLTGIDKTALAAYCEAYSVWKEACIIRNDLGKTWMTEVTTNGNTIQHPIVGIINQSRKAMKEYLIEFGMTPASRSKVHAADKKKTDNPFLKQA